MKKNTLGLTALAVVLLAGTAQANNAAPTTTSPKLGLYTSLEMGAGFPNDTHLSNAASGVSGTFSTNSGFAIAGAVGYHVLPWLRVEGEIGHFGANLGDGTLSYGNASVHSNASEASVGVTTYMANAFYDWHNGSQFTPYGGFGLGAANVSSSSPSTYLIQSNDSDTVFAWQLALGTAYKVTDDWSAVLGWRYLQTADASLNASIPSVNASGVMKASFGTNEIRAGLRYDF